ncbi:type III PLP-dependent enzyme domain-containing protein [Nocardia goodfellowii]|uniref:Diaminopimelate decarboxylase n=1 Tax=Nocardia goodfellowii TaxID=882446 RepID=A0ABS4QDB6_9NOCA|nr:type III PLP-dependent enzyme [Nocardia goodfellowii]MBP2189682.1 diaminopimelate decarboxylase [Nocardia goodfellowii]
MPDIAALVRQYGSPLYVYELDAVQQAIVDLRAALPAKSVVYYSLKANPHIAISRELRESGCRAEISSPGELEVALKAGFQGLDCLYTGPGKTDSEIDHALAKGVRRFSAESAGELDRIGQAALACGTEATVLLRINGRSAGATGLRMSGAESQFGVDEQQVIGDPGRFRDVPGVRLAGVHLFPLSNARDESSLIAAFQASIALAARVRDRTGLPLRIIDLGGGFATPYAQPGCRPTYRNLIDALSAALDEDLPGWRDRDIELAFESGRYLVGDSGRLITTVQDVKTSGTRTFVVVDAGINHLGGMAGLGRLAIPRATPEQTGGAATRVTLVGPLCTPADVLGREVEVPAPTPGDLLVVPNVGAYGLSASLVAFLGRPAPTEVVMARDRVVDVSRLRLTYENLPVEETVLEVS